jgi:hypothetical protein
MRHFKVEAFFVRIAALFVLCLPGAALMGEAYRDVPPAMRTVWGVTLNRDNASTLQAKLGPASSWKSGDGHDREVNWCFRAGSGATAATLHIASDDGEMGTETHEINVLHLLRGTFTTLEGHPCTRTLAAPVLGAVGPVTLGSTREDIERRLGSSDRHSADSLVYEIHAEEPVDPADPAFARWNTPVLRKKCFGGNAPFTYVGGQIVVKFANARVSEIRVERYNNAIC